MYNIQSLRALRSGKKRDKPQHLMRVCGLIKLAQIKGEDSMIKSSQHQCLRGRAFYKSADNSPCSRSHHRPLKTRQGRFPKVEIRNLTCLFLNTTLKVLYLTFRAVVQ